MTSQNPNPITRDTVLNKDMQTALVKVMFQKLISQEKDPVGKSGLGDSWNDRVTINLTLENLTNPTITHLQNELLKTMDGFTELSPQQRAAKKDFLRKYAFPTDDDLKKITNEYNAIQQNRLQAAKKQYEYENSPEGKAQKLEEQKKRQDNADRALMDEEDRWGGQNSQLPNKPKAIDTTPKKGNNR